MEFFNIDSSSISTYSFDGGRKKKRKSITRSQSSSRSQSPKRSKKSSQSPKRSRSSRSRSPKRSRSSRSRSPKRSRSSRSRSSDRSQDSKNSRSSDRSQDSKNSRSSDRSQDSKRSQSQDSKRSQSQDSERTPEKPLKPVIIDVQAGDKKKLYSPDSISSVLIKKENEKYLLNPSLDIDPQPIGITNIKELVQCETVIKKSVAQKLINIVNDHVKFARENFLLSKKEYERQYEQERIENEQELVNRTNQINDAYETNKYTTQDTLFESLSTGVNEFISRFDNAIKSRDIKTLKDSKVFSTIDKDQKKYFEIYDKEYKKLTDQKKKDLEKAKEDFDKTEKKIKEKEKQIDKTRIDAYYKEKYTPIDTEKLNLEVLIYGKTGFWIFGTNKYLTGRIIRIEPKEKKGVIIRANKSNYKISFDEMCIKSKNLKLTKAF